MRVDTRIPDQIFQGEIKAGDVFRHRMFDIYCVISERQSFELSYIPLDADGNRDPTWQVGCFVSEFRENWRPKPI